MNLIYFWIRLMKSDHVMGIKETILTNPPFQPRDITETILVNAPTNPLYVPIYCLSLPNCAAYFTCSHLKKLLLNIKYFLRSKRLPMNHRP